MSAEPLCTVAVIGGSGLYTLQAGGRSQPFEVATPFSDKPVTLYLETIDAGPVVFLPRHGMTHGLAPHEINYRANIWALKEAGVRYIFTVNAVGGISTKMQPGALLVPDQIIDYTWGREHSFHSGNHGFDKHIDFTWPFDVDLSGLLFECARQVADGVISGGVYGCTQGPRLETAAEIRKLAQDGCDVVGMTAMPEAALARELDLRYATLALVVNRAAGLSGGTISHEAMQTVLESGMTQIRQILLACCNRLLESH